MIECHLHGYDYHAWGVKRGGCYEYHTQELPWGTQVPCWRHAHVCTVMITSKTCLQVNDKETTICSK